MTQSRFARQFARTGAVSMLRQFGEPITYWASGASTGRSIWGIVERDVEMISEAGDVQGQAIIIRVKNNACQGISSTEIDTGGDEVAVPLRVGETAQRRAIVRVMGTANGLVRFMVQ